MGRKEPLAFSMDFPRPNAPTWITMQVLLGRPNWWQPKTERKEVLLSFLNFYQSLNFLLQLKDHTFVVLGITIPFLLVKPVETGMLESAETENPGRNPGQNSFLACLLGGTGIPVEIIGIPRVSVGKLSWGRNRKKKLEKNLKCLVWLFHNICNNIYDI